MKIAIIGTGNVGKAIGGSLVRAGHEVTFAARDAATTRLVASAAGASASASAADAARGAEVIILAVPYLAAEQVAAELDGQAAGKVVIDATNPIRADYSGLATGAGESGAEHFARLLEGAHVVKAFNTLFASVQADPGAHGARARSPVRDGRPGGTGGSRRAGVVDRPPPGRRGPPRGLARAGSDGLA